MTYPFKQLKQSTYYPSPVSGCKPSKETKFLDFASNIGFGPGNSDCIPGRQAEKEILQSKRKILVLTWTGRSLNPGLSEAADGQE